MKLFKKIIFSLTLILIAYPLQATIIHTPQATDVIKNADDVALATVLKTDKRRETCHTTISSKLKILDVLKGSIPIGKNVLFETTDHFPYSAKISDKTKCPNVSYTQKPTLKSLKENRIVLIALKKISREKWRALGIWDESQKLQISSLLDHSYSQTYKILDQNSQNSYRILAQAKSFEDTAIGFAGITPDSVHALRHLVKHAKAKEIFNNLLNDASLPGQIYSLCGLYAVDKKSYARHMQNYTNKTQKISMQSGCLLSKESVNTLFQTDQSNGLFSTLTFNQICENLITR